MNSENIITIPGQENTEVAALTPLQSALVPYVPTAIIFWWCMWAGMLAYVVVQHVVRPLLKK